MGSVHRHNGVVQAAQRNSQGFWIVFLERFRSFYIYHQPMATISPALSAKMQKTYAMLFNAKDL